MSVGLNKAKGRQQRVNKTHYQLQPARTTANKKRNLRNRIRSNPADLAAVARYEQNFGRADTLGMNGRGRKLAKRYAALGAAS